MVLERRAGWPLASGGCDLGLGPVFRIPSGLLAARINVNRCLSGKRFSLALLDGPAACRRAHQVGHQCGGADAIEGKSDDGTEQRAVAISGFCNAHHQHDINPGDNNEIHDNLGGKTL